MKRAKQRQRQRFDPWVFWAGRPASIKRRRNARRAEAYDAERLIRDWVYDLMDEAQRERINDLANMVERWNEAHTE